MKINVYKNFFMGKFIGILCIVILKCKVSNILLVGKWKL